MDYELSLSLCVYVLYVHTQYLCMPPCMRGLHGAKDFIWQFRSGRCTIELRPSVSARVRRSCTDGDRYHLAPTPSFVSISFTPLAFSSDLLSPLSFLRTLPLFSSSLRTSHSFGPRSGPPTAPPGSPPPSTPLSNAFVITTWMKTQENDRQARERQVG